MLKISDLLKELNDIAPFSDIVNPGIIQDF